MSPVDGRTLAYRAVVTLALAAAAGLVAAAVLSPDPEERTEPAAVEELMPEEGALEVSQTAVGIDLAPGWSTTDLFINGVRIPEDQLNVEPALNRTVFRPGQGQEFRRLPAGRVTVRARVRDELGGAATERVIRWSFQVS